MAGYVRPDLSLKHWRMSRGEQEIEHRIRQGRQKIQIFIAIHYGSFVRSPWSILKNGFRKMFRLF